LLPLDVGSTLIRQTARMLIPFTRGITDINMSKKSSKTKSKIYSIFLNQFNTFNNVKERVRLSPNAQQR
jgi:hypothetical protein